MIKKPLDAHEGNALHPSHGPSIHGRFLDLCRLHGGFEAHGTGFKSVFCKERTEQVCGSPCTCK